MPAIVVSDVGTRIRPYDVLAKGHERLMRHAMLCDEDGDRVDIRLETKLRISHMGPPLGTGISDCHAAGTAELTDTEKLRVKQFVALRLGQQASAAFRQKAFQYCIHPAAQPPSQKFAFWRFSCVGYVLEAYRFIDIHLLDDALPLKSAQDLKSFYPDFAEALDDPRKRASVGLADGDCWPVALVGYVLHSLARSVDEIRVPGARYSVREGDEYFPRNPSSTAASGS